MTTSSPASRIQANINELFQANLSPGDAYIRFQLTSKMTALLSMKQVEESLLIAPEEITPMPNMPESVIGIMSSRDRVLCVFDLAQLLNLDSSLIAPRQYQIIVLEVSKILSSEQSLYLGLAVNHLQGVIRLTSEKLQLPQDLPAGLTSYVRRCIWENEQQLLVLDTKAIAYQTRNSH
ncbi:MAG: chemotaxis protein CheW [Waterburya sp.]